jgi:6-phosphogluconolactonase
MNLHIYRDPESLSVAVAEVITGLIIKKLRSNERFTLLLSGGNTPKKLYSLLAKDEYRERINWKRIHVFFGDERIVPFSDERNNGRMAKEALIDHTPIPRDQVFYIDTERNVNEAVDEYEKILHQYFDGEHFSFDLSLMGMGEDAHTLSLFPGSPVIKEKKRWVVSLYLEEQKAHRISLTPAIVNKSNEIFFLVTGQSKATAMSNVLKGSFQPERYPAQLIRPTNGDIHWYIDESAGSKLNS